MNSNCATRCSYNEKMFSKKFFLVWCLLYVAARRKRSNFINLWRKWLDSLSNSRLQVVYVLCSVVEIPVYFPAGRSARKEMRRRVNCFCITDAVDGLADSGEGSRNFGVYKKYFLPEPTRAQNLFFCFLIFFRISLDHDLWIRQFVELRETIRLCIIS